MVSIRAVAMKVHGGRVYPTTELADLEGGEGHESIGSFRAVKRMSGVRILSRSNTLKLRAYGLLEGAFGRSFDEPVIVQPDAVHSLAGCCPTPLRTPRGSLRWWIGWLRAYSSEVVQRKDQAVQSGSVHQHLAGVVRPLFRTSPQFAAEANWMASVTILQGGMGKAGIVYQTLCANTSPVLSDRSSGRRRGSLRRQTG